MERSVPISTYNQPITTVHACGSPGPRPPGAIPERSANDHCGGGMGQVYRGCLRVNFSSKIGHHHGQSHFGVNPTEWETVLKGLGPESPRQQELLRQRWRHLSRGHELQDLLERQAATDLHWNDPDPDTAGWVLMVEKSRFPTLVQQRLKHPRVGLTSSPYLDAMYRDGISDQLAELPILATCSLFEDLPHAGLLEVASKAEVREWPQGSVVLKAGEQSDGLGVVLHGEAVVHALGREPIPMGQGKILGEMGVISGDPRSTNVIAGREGLEVFWLSTEAFVLLLRDSSGFTHGVLR